MSLSLLLRDASNHGGKYDGSSFLPVWEYIAKCCVKRYGKVLQSDDVEDLISFCTVQMLPYWFDKYDPIRSAPTTYAMRGMRNQISVFFRQYNEIKKRERMYPESEEEDRLFEETILEREEEEQVDENDLKNMREYILSHLTPIGKEIYHLWTLGWTYREIAPRVGLTAARIGQYVNKFRRYAVNYRRFFLK